MAEVTLKDARIRAGRWEGLLTGTAEAPEIEVLHLDRELEGVAVSQAGDGWTVSVPIPAELLSDGVQTFLVRGRATGTALAHFTVVTGVPLEDDLRAEIDLMRAELDLLKKAFRRLCSGTGE